MPTNPNALYLPARMGQVVLPNAASATAYTVPSGKMAVVQQVSLANTGAATQVFIGLVPRGGGVGGVGNRIIHNLDLRAESSLAFDLHQVLEAGDMVVGHAATASIVTMTVGGVEFDWPGDTRAWDAQPLGRTWDSIPAGTTWDSWSG